MPKHPEKSSLPGNVFFTSEKNQKTESIQIIFRGYLYNRPLDYLNDSSYILHVLKNKQQAGFAQLDGAFACAAYDRQTNTLMLARDRVGIQHIYYYIKQDELWFSDDLNALKKIIPVSCQICPIALCQYLQLNYIPAPLTIYEGINALLPGWCLTYNVDGLRMIQYWDLDTAITHNIREKRECINLLRETLTESVRSCIGDVEQIGVLLSGGTDSAIITGIASKMVKKLHTFTIGY